MENRKLGGRLKLTERGRDCMIAAGMTLLLMLLLGVLFDYYYCINDDTVMRDILCGSYTGEPESRNIQMLYPISAFISGLYRLIPTFPWYGLFLCGCQYISLFLICCRAIRFTEKLWMKLTVGAVTVLAAGGTLLYEFVFVQYTATCGIMMAAAAFWFYGSDATKGVKKFLLENSISVILVVLAFQIRTEMAILLLPFLLGAGLCKWAKEEKIFTKVNMQKYLGIIGSALLLMAVSVVVNEAAYSSSEWKSFNQFFDYRTEIYDFLGWPSYEEDADFYDSVGLSSAEATLIDNYNFALDEEIDENVLGQMTQYQKEQRGGSSVLLVNTGDALWIYKNSLLSADYMPYNGLILFVYLLLVIAAFQNRDKTYFWKIPMFGLIRTVCWMYIIFRNRTPDRITHGLFLMELMVLLGILAAEWSRKKASRMTIAALGCVIVVLSVPAIWTKVYKEAGQRQKINEEWQLLQEYCEENPENYYVIDVYSTVDYTEKMFENVDNSYRNYDLCGGWTAKSPLYEEKLAQGGVTHLEEDLAQKEHVYFVSKVNRDVEWLAEYYEQKGWQVRPEAVEEIAVNGEVRFVIYRLL